MTAGGPDFLAPGPGPEGTPADVAPIVDRIDIRSLLRSAVLAVLGVAVVGLIGGILWGLVVPGVTGVVVAPGRAGALGADTGHRFDAVAIFACISFVAGALGGVGVWWIRSLRGSVGAVSVAIGAVVGAALAAWIGGLIAGARHPGVGDTAVGQFFSSAPSLRLDGSTVDSVGGFDFSWAIVVIAPIGALLAYLVLLLVVRRADLGVAPSGRGTQGGELVGDA
ncbi:DUF2567 domain-containing protein [Williamsia phyllosphaerae]|uniref:DUF2567 domain-containing protein n=1 Tax=Williamsia phyllosphaerae TaxID=885042 RepID=A0ABQ1UY08_9NOCA|nr:DUF2567 domain-containing protein [Williamsia phyllosphaerae]GGF29911.1 hypothetical protein GCM10007298_27330 [Williamsia phyllosphaerae]